MNAVTILWIILLGLGCAGSGSYEPRNGDVVFQTSRSAQSVAIQKATRSPWSHLGIVYLRGGEAFVYEAVDPVRSTPLESWIDRGEGRRCVVKRLRHADQVLTPAALSRMLEAGEAFRGRRYDSWFEWSDDRLYCSELVWKIYQRALGIELGRLQTMATFDFSDPLVRSIAEERWHGAPPANEPVISPAAIFESEELVVVHRR